MAKLKKEKEGILKVKERLKHKRGQCEKERKKKKALHP